MPYWGSTQMLSDVVFFIRPLWMTPVLVKEAPHCLMYKSAGDFYFSWWRQTRKKGVCILNWKSFFSSSQLLQKMDGVPLTAFASWCFLFFFHPERFFFMGAKSLLLFSRDAWGCYHINGKVSIKRPQLFTYWLPATWWKRTGYARGSFNPVEMS